MKKNFQLMVLSLTVISMSCCPVNSAILFNHEIGIETVSKPKDQIIDPIHTTPSDDTGQSATFQSDCAVYGFDIDGQWYPHSGTTFNKKVYKRYDQGHLQYQTDIQQVLLQNINDSNAFSVVYRIVTSPVGTRHWGFLGIGSHSDTWYTREINSAASLGAGMTMGQWAPKNEFATYSGSIGIGADSSGPSISASVNFTINQLTVTSLTNVATKHYETDYYISSDNNYNRYSAEYIGFFSFTRDSASVSPHFVMSHKISYHGVEWFGLETKTYNISV